MTLLITADLHLSDNPRDSYRHSFMAKLPKLAKSQKASHVIIAGDLTEAKDRHSAVLVNQVVDHLQQIAKVCPVILLRGNHDGLTSDHSFFEFVDQINDMRWISLPTPLLIKDGEKEYRYQFLPHTTNHERDWKNVDFKRATWVFAHNTFHGADVGHGRRMDGIPLDAIPKTCRVISGDVHVPQKLGHVTYVGSPFLVDFGDTFEPRVLVIDGKNVKSIPIEGSQKKLVEVKWISDIERQDTLNKDDILKVRVHIAQGDFPRWPDMVRQVREWGAKHGYIIHAVQPIIAAESKAKKRVSKDPQSDKDVLRAYAQRREVDEQTLAVGLHLLEK